jgi:diguanylate cyclase (GGDEF)-like protein
MADRSALPRVINAEALYYWYEGSLQKAVELLRQGIRASRDVGDIFEQNAMRVLLGHISWDKGDLKLAISEFEKLSQSTSIRDKVHADSVLALLYLYRGDVNRSETALARAKDLCNACEQPGIELHMALFEGMTLFYGGNKREAVKILNCFLSEERRYHLPLPWELKGRIYLSEAMLHNLPEARRQEANEIITHFKHLRKSFKWMIRIFPAYNAQWLRLEAMLHAYQGDFSGAERYLKNAIGESEKYGLRFVKAQAIADLGALNLSRVEKPLSSALASFIDIGANKQAEAVMTLLKDAKYIAPEMPSSEDSHSTEESFKSDLSKKLKMSSILEINQAISAILDFDELLKKIMDTVIELMKAQRGFLMILDDITQRFSIKVARNMDKKSLEDGTYHLSETIIQQVMKNKSPVLISDAETDPEFQLAASIAGQELKSILCVPLKRGARIIGIIYLENNLVANLFDEEALKTILEVTAQATISIENARLYTLATTDGLTGLYLRRYMENRLRDEFERARRYKRSMSLLMMDIDHFKRINDSRGHQVGDEVLKGVAQILKTQCREVDLIARYGGEEFCVILPETASREADAIAKRLREATEAATFCGDLKVTISIGLITFPECGVEHQQALIEKADMALYKAKEGGRNRIASANTGKIFK